MEKKQPLLMFMLIIALFVVNGIATYCTSYHTQRYFSQQIPPIWTAPL